MHWTEEPVMELSDEEIDHLEKRVRGQFDGTGLPWSGIGPDELLSLICEVKRLRIENERLADLITEYADDLAAASE
jgi:hypothetical protein